MMLEGKEEGSVIRLFEDTMMMMMMMKFKWKMFWGSCLFLFFFLFIYIEVRYADTLTFFFNNGSHQRNSFELYFFLKNFLPRLKATRGREKRKE